MPSFLDDDFLLQTDTARRLYYDYAADLPIIDYHNHLPPQQIATNHRFANLTEAWLAGDHYKWRAMRANGIPERYVTGDAGPREKFRAWARTVPKTLRNPLYHWTHLELRRYFGFDGLLSEDTADEVYDLAGEHLSQPSHTAQGLLEQMNVEVVCTTDHPTDTLRHHRQHGTRARAQDVRMLPTFRPDKLLTIGAADFTDFLAALETTVDQPISTYAALRAALVERIDYFGSLGCMLSDHGLAQLYPTDPSGADLDGALARRRAGHPVTPAEQAQWQTALLLDLGRAYHARGWTMQLHLGPLRNNNRRLLRDVGADVGCDSIGDRPQAEGLSYFLGQLDEEGRCPKTILYNLNPRDNEVFATMAGNFNDGSQAGKMQWGSAWWFLDQKDGMERQLDVLSNMGLLSRFVGMLTDSRSFLSFPRHEYFRRILCNMLGEDVRRGLVPHDVDLLGSLVADVCYRNARDYFGFAERTKTA